MTEALRTQGNPAQLALFSAAHHDIWWAKGHAWTVCNWTITGIAGVASLAHLKGPAGGPALSPTLVAIIANGIALLSNAYIAQMQADMVVARLRVNMIADRHAELRAILNEATRGMSIEPSRGIWFMRFLVVFVSTASALATFLTLWDIPLSSVLGGFEAALGWVLIEYLPCRKVLTAHMMASRS